MAYDKPEWAKRIEALEAVRDNMQGHVQPTQYLHNYRHFTGGEDPLTPAQISAADRVHKHSYTDITDLQNLVNGYAPGENPNFPGGVGGLKDIDLSALAEKLKQYGVGAGRCLFSDPNKASGSGTWMHVFHNCTPGKMLYIVTRSNRGTSLGLSELRWGGGTLFTAESQDLSGLNSPRDTYQPVFNGPSLQQVIDWAEAKNNSQIVIGQGPDILYTKCFHFTCASISARSSHDVNDGDSMVTRYSYNMELSGALIMAPTVRVMAGTGDDWGTWYEIWEV